MNWTEPRTWIICIDSLNKNPIEYKISNIHHLDTLKCSFLLMRKKEVLDSSSHEFYIRSDVLDTINRLATNKKSGTFEMIEKIVKNDRIFERLTHFRSWPTQFRNKCLWTKAVIHEALLFHFYLLSNVYLKVASRKC